MFGDASSLRTTARVDRWVSGVIGAHSTTAASSEFSEGHRAAPRQLFGLFRTNHKPELAVHVGKSDRDCQDPNDGNGRPEVRVCREQHWVSDRELEEEANGEQDDREAECSVCNRDEVGHLFSPHRERRRWLSDQRERKQHRSAHRPDGVDHCEGERATRSRNGMREPTFGPIGFESAAWSTIGEDVEIILLKIMMTT